MKPAAVPVHDEHENQSNPVVSVQDEHHDDQDQQFKQYNATELRAIKIQGYLTLIGGVALHFVLGTFYLWGGISPYVGAYMKAEDESVTLSTMAMIFPILGIITMSVLSFGVKLAAIVGFKTMVFGGGFFISLAFLILAFIRNLIGFIIIYCVMIGLSTGLVYMLPILCGWKFFPFHRGRVSGLIIAGYGFGAFIFNFVCQGYVNPNNRKPDVIYMEDGKETKYFGPEIYNKVPNMFLILSGSYFALTIIATLLVRYPRDLNLEYQHVLSNGKKPSGISHTKALAYHPTVMHSECETLKQGLLSRPFYFMMPMIVSSVLFGMLMANSYKTYGLEIGLSDQMLTIIGSLASISNGCSRLFWASLMDRYGFKKIYLIIIVLKLICTASMGYIGNSGQGVGYLFILFITMSCEGGLLSMFPAQSSKMFGHKVGPIIYGFLFFGIGLSNMSAYLLQRFTYASIGFQGLFWVCFGIKVIALILGIFFKEEHTWRR